METVKDLEGNNHLIFDETSLYDDSQMGDSLSDFETLQVLSENNSCFVTKVRSLNNHKIYAMKKIELSKMEPQNRPNYINEINKLKDLNNPHIIKYHKILNDNSNSNNLYLIMEFMNNSDINGYIKAHQVLKKNIKEEEIWNILLQCLSALDYLHQQNLQYLGIRFKKIFMNNEQNVKIGVFNEHVFTNQIYDSKEDIRNLGKYFYIMCFSQDPRVLSAKSFDEVEIRKVQNEYYSNELMDRIYKMAVDDTYQMNDIKTFYKHVKEEYVKKYAKNTSIKAVLRCLYAFPNFNKIMFKEEEKYNNNKNNFYINYWYLKAIKALAGFEESNLQECIEEFRRAIASENSKLDGNKEIDPLYLLAFLLEKMHKETNIKEGNSELKDNQNKKYVISSEFSGEEEDKTNKEQMLYKFVNYFNSNIKSPISDLFFGFIKTKQNCQTCRCGYYSFSNYCFVVYDISNNENNNKEFDLVKDGFEYQHFNPKTIEGIYCDNCLSCQKHLEFNRYYIMNHQLVISFIRGNNYKSTSNIAFSENLDLDKYVEEKTASPCHYSLVGCIIKKQQEDKFEFYARDPDNKNVWHKSDEKITQPTAPIQDMKREGQIIMLFYNNKNLISA